MKTMKDGTQRPRPARARYIERTPGGYLVIGRRCYRGWLDFVGQALTMATVLVLFLVFLWFIRSCQTDDWWPLFDSPKYEEFARTGATR